MLAQVLTGAVRGVDAFVVQVEVHIAPGLPSFTVVGLARGSVREGRERVAAALRSGGFALPNRRLTVNLAPAGIGKDGTAFDLPIAIGVLAASGRIDAAAAAGSAFLGELGLDGSLRPVNGVLPVAARCGEAGIGRLFVAEANAAEAALVDALEVLGARTLEEVVAHVTGERPLRPRTRAARAPSVAAARGPDLADVRGQATARRALEIAAAGGHNLLMIGPPGSGKTMLARRLPGILPRLTRGEALEASRIHSVAGRLRGGALLASRPFRAPHHSVSYAGLVGGGVPVRPGEISLAHRGVLFLDELAEYRRDVLEVLRQPLEEGEVRLARANGAVRFPARFQLVAAMNPCPCGRLGDGTDGCLCDPARVARYRGRVSGPLLDRIDLHLEVPPVPFEALSGSARGESSEEVRRRVERARAARRARVRSARGAGPAGGATDAPPEARASSGEVRPASDAVRTLQRAVERLGLSARAYHRVLDVARTIADLEGAEVVGGRHAAEAVQYRVLDRRPI